MKDFLNYPLRRILPLYLVWWILWAFLQSFILHRLALSWETSLLDSGISSLILAASCLISIMLNRFYQPGVQNRIYRFIFAIGITGLYCVTFKWLALYFIPGNPTYLTFLEASMPLRFVIALMMLSFLTLISWVLNSIRDQNEKETRRMEAEQLVKEAELVKLRQQLQPHFLFNSLNSISALAASKPNEARKMIQQLSDFLRGTLKKDEQQLVTLSEELEHLKLYLEIEKVRFGHRLNTKIDIQDEALTSKIPPLLLQPIVENAIKFGLYGTTDEITIAIDARIENALLHIEVKNPFDEQTQNSSQGTGFGLNSVQRRLFLLFARQDLLVTESKGNEFVTRLKIPQSLKQK